MSFIITDCASDQNELRINGWSWRPTLEIIATFGIIDEERLELMGYNAGTEIAEVEAHLIGEKILREILPKLNLESRVLSDLSITEEPDNGEFYRNGNEIGKNYSAGYDWLEKFARFCISSKGFEVY